MRKRNDVCGTYGCTLPDKHRGLHCIPPLSKRRIVSSVIQFDQFDQFDNRKHAIVPPLRTIECLDDREDVLILDPIADFLATGHRSPPPSPYPMKEEALITSHTASPTPSDLEIMLNAIKRTSSLCSPTPSVTPSPPTSPIDIIKQVANILWS